MIKLKIGFCTPGGMDFEDYKSGNLLGIESQVFGLAKELTKYGHEIYIFRRWPVDDIKIETIFDIKIVNFKTLDFHDSIFQKVFTKVNFSYYVKKEIEKLNLDILILTDLFASYFIKNLKIPKIYVTHAPPSELFGDTGLKKKFKIYCEKKLFKECEILISLNSSINDYLSSKGYNSVFIQNAIEEDLYNPNYHDENYIFFGGRLDKIKGLEYLIISYSLLNENLKNEIKLIIVGYGTEKEYLTKLVEELGLNDYVDFIPWLAKKDLRKKIADSTIFVLPSLSECMPVTLLEAMALGKTVIASNIPGSNDVISHFDNGFLFEKKNVQELKKYLDLVVKDSSLRIKIGHNARKTIESQYTFKEISKKYMAIFDQIKK